MKRVIAFTCESTVNQARFVEPFAAGVAAGAHAAMGNGSIMSCDLFWWGNSAGCSTQGVCRLRGNLLGHPCDSQLPPRAAACGGAIVGSLPQRPFTPSSRCSARWVAMETLFADGEVTGRMSTPCLFARWGFLAAQEIASPGSTKQFENVYTFYTYIPAGTIRHACMCIL